MNIITLMDEVAENLATLTGLRVHAFVPDSVAPPTAVVGFPTIEYDLSATGGASLTLPVHVLVGKAHDRAARLALGPYMGDAADSIRAAVETDPTFDGACDTSRVTSATVSVMTVAGADYLAATFTLAIWISV